MKSDDEKTMPFTDNEMLNRIYRLSGTDEAAEIYDQWAATYDKDTVEGMGYVAPRMVAERTAEILADGARVLDAGCGTGLVGKELHQRRPDLLVDGVDLSPGMLVVARKLNAYQELSTADLTAPIDAQDDQYDAVVCVGTLTRGHLGPEPLEEMARVVRPGGVVVATVLDAIWEDGGFREFIEAMAEQGVTKVVEADLRPYHLEERIDCRLVVLEVLPSAA